MLEPGSPADSHPYPVELDLPSWSLAADIDLRTWLFAVGASIRGESPPEPRQEHQEKPQAALSLDEPAASIRKEVHSRRWPERLSHLTA